MFHTNISSEELKRRVSSLQSIVDDINKYLDSYVESLPAEVLVKGAEPILRKMGTYLAEGHGPGCQCPAFAEILVKPGCVPTETIRIGVARTGDLFAMRFDVRTLEANPEQLNLLKCSKYDVTVREIMTSLRDLIDGSLALASVTQAPARA